MFLSQQRPGFTQTSFRIWKRFGSYVIFPPRSSTSRISSRIFWNASPRQCSEFDFSWTLPSGGTSGLRSRQQGRISPLPVTAAVYQAKKQPSLRSLNEGATGYIFVDTTPTRSRTAVLILFQP